MTAVQRDGMVAPLASALDLRDAGGIVFIAHLDATDHDRGPASYLLLQTPGLFHAAIHGGAANVGWNHFCLTAFSQSGQLRWQVGTPWRGSEPYASHGGERALVVDDLDRDGRAEVCVIRGSEVLVLDAATGAQRCAWPLPFDNFVVLAIGRCGERRHLLASPANQGYDGHGHGGPTLLLDHTGRQLMQRDIHGFGHDPVAVDLNGDGCDEWLVGYEALAAGGELTWRFEPVPRDRYDDLEMHVDGLSLHLCDQPSRRRIAYAASTFVYVVDLDGQLKWSRELVHPQQVIFANLREDVPGPQLFVLNKRDTLQLFDFDGRLLWTQEPAEHWPWGKPAGVLERFHLFDPALRLRSVLSNGLDAIVYVEGGWPYALDGHGRRVLDFQCPSQSKQGPFKAYRRPDDFGAGYVARAWSGPVAEHLVVVDRRHLWRYDLPHTTAICESLNGL